MEETWSKGLQKIFSCNRIQNSEKFAYYRFSAGQKDNRELVYLR
jgi:hypothetical protein